MSSDVTELERDAPAGKSPLAFRTISEVADQLDVPQHVLRFWESRFPQVKPLKRGGGRRYYRPSDVELLTRIRDLLYRDGYTIKGVQKLLRDGTARTREPSGPAEDSAACLPLEQPKTPASSAPAEPLEAILHELMELSNILRRNTR